MSASPSGNIHRSTQAGFGVGRESDCAVHDHASYANRARGRDTTIASRRRTAMNVSGPSNEAARR
jgi:hypothetical protein